MGTAAAAGRRASGGVWHLVTLVAIGLVRFGLLVVTATSVLRTSPAQPPARCFATSCPDQRTPTVIPRP